ncbi:MAG: RNase adapter RapZ [Coriobacteriia bacterium]|nr:RNase adapter RapZ [Coriobacteriia bacterium]MCL2750368.1 RNase adapter RapZ [Coriobacteriia bacterium]
MSSEGQVTQDNRDACSIEGKPEAMQTKPTIVVITGMAGAGKTQALHTFEDIGYFCIDNLPPSLLLNLVSLAGIPGGASRRLAVVCDLRSGEFFAELEKVLVQLAELHVDFNLLFLDADDNALLTRYKETRRRHPLCSGTMTLSEGIDLERKQLSSVREMGNYVIDTTGKSTRALRKEIRKLYDPRSGDTGLSVSVSSFGFKHGFPKDVDIMIDVRFLPNPFYEEELRPLTGLDEQVCNYVLNNEQTQEFLDKWTSLLATIMPGYVQEGKRYLTIAIGCTGGQHRSVVLAEQTAQFLKDYGYSTSLSHRDILLANRTAGAGRGSEAEDQETSDQETSA